MLSFGRWSGHVHLRPLLACLTVGCLASFLLLEARAPEEPLRIDEAEWVTAGYVTWKLVREAAPTARWERAYDERNLSDWGNRNPPIGKLVIGVAVAPHVISDAAVQYHASIVDAPEQQRPPPTAMLIAARTSIALCAALLLWATYLLAAELLNRSLWACAAPLALFLVPNFQWHATHVYTDMPQLALASFGAHALLVYARTRRFGWFVWCLVAGGLSCAVKFSAGAFCAATVAYAASELFGRARRFMPLAAAVVIPLVTFVAVNPYLYDRPIAKSVQIMSEWRLVKQAQRQQHGDAAVRDVVHGVELVAARGAFAPASIPGVPGEITRRAWLVGADLAGLAALALTVLSLVGMRLRLAAPASRVLLLSAAAVGGYVLQHWFAHKSTPYGALCGVGLVALYLEVTANRSAAARALALVLGVTTAFTILWVPLDWSRYFLPNVTLMSVVYPLGVAAIARSIRWSGAFSPDAGQSLRPA